ncbi:kinase-like domain-containing protein, partial [Coemansia mojavensis]
IPKIYEYGELVETFYIKMEKKEGETLNMSNITMSSSERSSLVEEILKFRERLADSLPKRDSIKYYERRLDRCKPLEFVRKSLPALCKNHPLVFCHGDLHPSNIIIKDGKISGIVDWEMSSFYPSSYEYC